MTPRDIFACWSRLGRPVNVTALSPGMARIGTPARTFYLKRRDDPERVRRELGLLELLARTGVPVPAPIPSDQGTSYVTEGGHVYWLASALAGEHLDEFEGPSGLEYAACLGRALGETHQRLAEVPDSGTFPVFRESAESSIARLLDRSTPFEPQRLEQVRSKVLSGMALPEQLIHRDPHPRNLLFSEGRLSGFLDFELVHTGPRLFDLCYCASAILSGPSDTASYGEYWLGVLRSSFDAYDAVNALTGRERSMAWTMLVTIELIFMGYLLDVGNPEGAMKTYEMLLWIDGHREQVAAATAGSGSPAHGA